MSQTAKTAAQQTEAVAPAATPAPQMVISNTPDSTKDAGRVHIGGGVIVF